MLKHFCNQFEKEIGIKIEIFSVTSCLNMTKDISFQALQEI